MPPKALITLDGIPIPETFAEIIEVIVDTNVFLPGMFTLLIQDKAGGILKDVEKTDNMLRFKLGTEVNIRLAGENLGSLLPTMPKSLIQGEITSIEPVFDRGGGVFLRVRGYDFSHRLTYGKNVKSFAMMTDSMIITKILGEAGLVPAVSSTTALHENLIQYNQSDWDFIWSRAQLLGYQLYADGKVIHFDKAGKSRGFGKTTLSWGKNLLYFEPRMVVEGQVSKTVAVGWDEEKKQEITGDAGSSKDAAEAKIGDMVSSKMALGMVGRITSKDFVVDSSITSSGIAKSAAQARMDDHVSQFVRASGEALGDEDLVAGTKIDVKDVGIRFSGEYYVTEARHIWNETGYVVQFQVSGRNPYTLRSLILGQEQPANRISGVMVGIVTNNMDLKNKGRVKVKYPWLKGFTTTEIESGWIRFSAPGAGKERGMYFMPEVNDEVLVAFEQGDINAPYVVGALWNGKDKPPKPNSAVVKGGMVGEHIIRSRSGHVIIMDDTSGGEKITITDKTGKNSIEIDSVKNSMVFKTQGDLTFEAGGKLSINSKLDFIVDAKTKAAISAGASQLELQAAGTTLKGTKVDIQGQAQTNIQGAMTSIKGSGVVEIQGGLVKIN